MLRGHRYQRCYDYESVLRTSVLKLSAIFASSIIPASKDATPFLTTLFICFWQNTKVPSYWSYLSSCHPQPAIPTTLPCGYTTSKCISTGFIIPQDRSFSNMSIVYYNSQALRWLSYSTFPLKSEFQMTVQYDRADICHFRKSRLV